MASRRRVAATAGDIQGALSALKDDVSDLADQVTQILGSKGEDAVRDLEQRAARLRNGLGAVAFEAGKKGRAAVDDATGNLREFGESLEDAFRERPMTMIALAVGLGIAIGTVLRR